MNASYGQIWTLDFKKGGSMGKQKTRLLLTPALVFKDDIG